MQKRFTTALLKTIAYVMVLLVLFGLTSIANYSIADIVKTALFAFVLYVMFFGINRPAINTLLQEKIRPLLLALYAVLVMTGMYFGYAVLNGVNPFGSELMFIPVVLILPMLAMIWQTNYKPVNWIDFTVLFLFFIPLSIYRPEFTGKLPLAGSVLDSVFRLVVMISPVIAFGVIRGIKGIGFYPSLSLRSLGIVVLVWLLFYSVAFLIGYNADFIEIRGVSIDLLYFYGVIYQLVRIFIHTALFEELFFRGLLQNMLTQKVKSNWKKYFIYGVTTLIVLSIICGFLMKGAYGWMPVVVAVLLSAWAWWLETKRWQKAGTYTALALTSILFGLLHFHAGSIVFVALAGIGGWAYGYTYIKTGSTFYAALLHALVNTTPYILGLQLVK